MSDEFFPKVKKGIDAFLEDEEGNIPRSKILTVGSLMMLMGIIYGQNIYAAHSSHSSHASHSSGENPGSHSSHESHQSHQSHVSGSTHASHSNSTHSNAAPHSNSAPSNSVSPSDNGSITSKVPVSKMKTIGTIQTPVSNKVDGSLAKASTAIPAVKDTPKFNK